MRLEHASKRGLAESVGSSSKDSLAFLLPLAAFDGATDWSTSIAAGRGEVSAWANDFADLSVAASAREAEQPTELVDASMGEAERPEDLGVASAGEAERPGDLVAASTGEAERPGALVVASTGEAERPDVRVVASIGEAERPEALVAASAWEAVRPGGLVAASAGEAGRPGRTGLNIPFLSTVWVSIKLASKLKSPVAGKLLFFLFFPGMAALGKIKL